MKKIIFLLFCLVFLVTSKNVHAQEAPWKIANFQSEILIRTDGAVNIKETVNVDFDTTSKHGIFRYIPYQYQNSDNTKTYTRVTVLGVTQDNRPAQFTQTQDQNNIIIKIGNPNKTITGSHVYQIEYTAEGILKEYSTYDELYWNVTGQGWEVPIENASATVSLPEDILQNADCFNGVAGTKANCSIKFFNKNTANFKTGRTLQANEGMTIVIAYDKNQIAILSPQPPRPVWETLNYPKMALISLLTIAFGVFMVIRKWYTSGRDFWLKQRFLFDKKAKAEKEPLFAHNTIVVEYSPPQNLRPAQIGVLIDEKADTLDVTSTIVDLAVRGYLTITEKPKKWVFGKVDYLLEKTAKNRVSILPYENLLLEKLFEGKDSVLISSLKQTFYSDLKKVKTKIYEDVISSHFFERNPETVRVQYFAVAIAVGIAAMVSTGIALANNHFYFGTFTASVIVDSAILAAFAQFMPRRTAFGHQTYNQILGYRLFIEKAEKHRQRFFENKNLFNEVLPYAIVFGLTEKLAKSMDKIGVKPNQPSWYSGAGPFNPVVFNSNVNTFSTSFSSAIAAAPKSSGFSSGGSSGGGFGGGGGGSW